jgi:hypothetical protein
MKKLTKLVVTEVSSVDRAANPGARIVLMKRDDRDEAAAELERLIAEELRANPSFNRLQAATNVRDRLSAKEKPTRKEQPVETVADIIQKHGGIVAISKRMAEANDSFNLFTEQSFTDEIVSQAKRDNVSFERLFTTPEISKAYRLVTEAKHVAMVTKNMPGDYRTNAEAVMSLEPIVVSGDDVTDETDKAHQKLMAMAEKQRANAPWLSIEQAYERVFTAKENAEFSRRAVTSFRFVT